MSPASSGLMVRTRFASHELVCHPSYPADQLKRNARMLAAQQDIFSISDQVITNLIQAVAEQIGRSWRNRADQASSILVVTRYVAHASELSQIAVIDVLASFANVSQGEWT